MSMMAEAGVTGREGDGDTMELLEEGLERSRCTMEERD